MTLLRLHVSSFGRREIRGGISARTRRKVGGWWRHGGAGRSPSFDRSYLDWITALVVVLEPGGRIVHWNRACEEALGYSREEVRGRALWDGLMGEASAEALRAALARLREGEHGARLESVCIARDGCPRAIVWSCQARLDRLGGLASIVATGTEVTEQRAARMMLARAGAALEGARQREALLAQVHVARATAERERSRLDAILQSVPTGMLFVDPSLAHVVANSALLQLVQRPICMDRGPGFFLGELRGPRGEPMTAEEMPWMRALRGQRVQDQQLCLEEPAGEWIQLIASASPVWGAPGESLGAVASFQDVSARCRLEQLQRDYVSLISHDLGGPLNAMATGVQLLQELLGHRSGAAVEAAQASIVRRIEQSCRTMKSMIEDLLEVGRLESGWIEPWWADVDVQALITRTLDGCLGARERDRVRVAARQAVSPVMLDPQRIGRVVLNLVVNALKFSPPDSPVDVDIDAGGERVIIAVRDRGPGIEPAEAERLFEKHYRTEATRQAGGSGLGLYICRLIVDAHGGEIRVDSVPGAGATFQVSLPRRQARAPRG